MAIVKKISELTPKGSNLGTTDLLIVGVDNGTDYDLKSVTGAQLLGTVVSQTITDGVTTKSPSENVVFDALALKVDKVVGERLITSSEATILGNTSGTNTGDNSVNTNSNAYADAKVTDDINNGSTTIAPSQNAVFDALNGKMSKNANLSDVFDIATARTNLGLGSLATQSGTFSGTSSGTNTGDQIFLDARVQTVTSSATVTPLSTNDFVKITAQAVGLTLANPTGTFTEGQALMVRIKDNGTARTIAFDTNYRAIGVTLPTTTVISKTLYLGIIYNSTDTKWDVIGYNIQA